MQTIYYYYDYYFLFELWQNKMYTRAKFSNAYKIQTTLVEELLDIVGDIQSLQWFYCTCDNAVSDLVAYSNVNNNGSVIDQKLKAIESKLCQKIDDRIKNGKIVRRGK